MNLDDYKVVLYGNQPAGWVAEIPAIPGCYALMEMREEAVSELARVFEMIAAECARIVAALRGRRNIPCGSLLGRDELLWFTGPELPYVGGLF
jgi:hypothetical protein